SSCESRVKPIGTAYLSTGQGKTWTEHRVSSMRSVNGIHAYLSVEKNNEWLTMSEVAFCRTGSVTEQHAVCFTTLRFFSTVPDSRRYVRTCGRTPTKSG